MTINLTIADNFGCEPVTLSYKFVPRYWTSICEVLGRDAKELGQDSTIAMGKMH